LLVRSNYLQGCEAYFDMLSAGKTKEASDFFYGELSRSFQNYNETVKKLFDYNMRQGMDRGQTILNTANYAPWIIAGLSVLVFVFGLVLGLRFAWSSPKPVRSLKTNGGNPDGVRTKN
jgi:hypothetical protein